MYLWNIDQLKEDLVETGLSQSELFKYIFVYVVLSSIVIELVYAYPAESLNSLDHMQSIFSLLLTGIGTYLCFRANGGAAGKNFAERFFSRGLVIVIRFLALFVPLLILLAIVFWSGEDPDDYSTKWYDVVVVSIWSLAMYWRFIVHINQVARRAAGQ